MVAAAPAGPQRGRGRPDPQAVGEDHAGARVQGRHGLLRPRRADPLPGQARLQPGRVRLHHLHRQLRTARRRGVARRSTTDDLAVVAVLSGNRNFEGRINPDVTHELPGLAAAGRGLRAGRDDGHRPGPRAARPPTPTGKPVYLRDIWPSPEEVDAVIAAARWRRRCSPADYADVFAGDERWRGLPTPAGRHLRLGRQRRPTCAARRTSTACRAQPGARHRHQRRPGAGHARATRSPPTTSRPAGVDPGRQPGRAVPGRARRRARRTSTPTARGAATTR